MGEVEDAVESCNSALFMQQRLMKDLDGFLERSQDRALFDLPPRADPGT